MEKRDLKPIIWYALICVFAVAVFVTGVVLVAQKPHNWLMLAAGSICVVIAASAWPIAYTLSSARVLKDSSEVVLQPLIERVEQLGIMLNLMCEQQLLSDRAKAVAFREKDREALHRAIHEEMAKQDWEAAFALADDVERAFGYRAEAERLRTEIRNARQDSVRKLITDAIGVIDRLTRSEQWTAAQKEAERLLTLFPENEQVKNLPHEIDARRLAQKKQLLQSWNEAVARHDVDGSIEILRQLDTYLTPDEAGGMQETARGVFKEKLTNLGAQFAAAVRDHRWTEAIKVGDGITRDFPNTRIAQEVREKMDLLRKRASEPATPGVPVAVATA